MAEVIAAAGTLFTSIFGATGWLAGVISFVTSQSYVLIGVSLMLVGSILGFLKRLISST